VYHGHYQLKSHTNYTDSLITSDKVGAEKRGLSHMIYLWSNTDLSTLDKGYLEAYIKTKETSKLDIPLDTKCYHPSF
jgi:hypothetical protein